MGLITCKLHVIASAWLFLLLGLLSVHGRAIASDRKRDGNGVLEVIPGQYIIMYSEAAGNVPAATLRLVQHIQSAASESGSDLVAPAAAAPNNNPQPTALFTVQATLDGSPVSVAAAAAAAAAASDTPISTEAGEVTSAEGQPGRLLGVVVQVQEGVDEQQLVLVMESAPHVQAVLPDLYVRAAQEPDPISPTQSAKPCASNANQQAAVAEAGSMTLPRQRLAANEIVPFGVRRIEAATCAGVADVQQQQQQQQGSRQRQPVVAVVDSGVDENHPDLNYVGGVSFVKTDDHSTKPSVDYFGHGTHVAGTVGAKNNGQGVVGVSPGIPIYSVKVLNSTGWGEASTTLRAVDWLVAEGGKLGIQIINLSLAAYISRRTLPKYFKHLCSVYEKASAAGMLVVASAGNVDTNLLDFVPAGCPGVAAVTGLDFDGKAASTSSSWVPSNAPAEVKARVICAPAQQIISTVPRNVDPSGYKLLGGTSQAAPHVSGVGANCIMSGACAAGTTGMEKLAVIQAAARERRRRPPSYGFRGDPARPGSSSRYYYGYLVWAGKF